MILGFNFGKLGNNNLFSVPSEPIEIATITVIDQNGNYVSGVKVEISNSSSIFISYTDNNGRAEIKGVYGEYYTLTISGNNIETQTISDWQFQDNFEIKVSEKPYLELNPEYIFLCPGNKYTDNVDILSNVDWFIH